MRKIAWDDRARLWGDDSVVLGGAPWGLLKITQAGRPFVRRLRDAGECGVTPAPGLEQTLGDLLLARGIVHPLIDGGHSGTGLDVNIVVPCYERPELLDACLDSLRRTAPDARIIVVDDASPSAAVGAVARSHGATLVRHEANRGPAAARNTGLREAHSALVVFIDADCVAMPGWLSTVTAHFEDPRVAAVSPRIMSRSGRRSLLARYESVRSALDMGPRPELVKPGAPLGFLPSAALAVRVTALDPDPFDERLRVGEDVDLVWRLTDAGALVRYEPRAVVTHEIRPAARAWAAQIFGYGTSAAELDRRHPGRLTPARLTSWNVVAAVLTVKRQPKAAAAVLGVAAVGRIRMLRNSAVDPRVTAVVMGKSLMSDATAIGHLLRREWWPIGWLVVTAAARSRGARAAAAVMVVPLIGEWLSRRPTVDLPRYLLLHLIEDAAYGSGVIVSAVRSRRPGVLPPYARPKPNQRPSAQKKPRALSL